MAQVGCFEHHDISLHARSESPFNVELEAKFTGPGAAQFTIPGFYNDDGEWLIRFSPPTVGEWHYRTVSGVAALDGAEGLVTAVAQGGDKLHGGLKVDHEHPHHFVFEDGTRHFALGYECDWLFALDLGGDGSLPKTTCLVDDIAANGFNQVVMNVYAHQVKKSQAWKLEGDRSEFDFNEPCMYPFGGSNAQPDHTRLNIDFFKHLDRVMILLRSRGVLAHLMLYVWNKSVAWPARGSDEDKRYVDYLMARYQGFCNVIWDVAKEALTYGQCDEAFLSDHVRRIRAKDAYHRLVTVHDGMYCAKHADLVDFLTIQVWATDLHSEMKQLRDSLRMPIVNIEHGGYERSPFMTFPGGYQDPVVCLERNYACVFAGTYSTYYWQGTSWNIVIHDRAVLSADQRPGYEYFGHLQAYFAGIDYHSLVPGSLTWREGRNWLLSNGYALAAPDGRAYWFFKPTGDYAMWSGVPKTWGRVAVEWFNPLTGERLQVAAVDGVSWHELRSPWGEGMAIARIEPG